jgi:cell division protein FtsB
MKVNILPWMRDNWRRIVFSFYFFAGLGFVVWLTFFDSNDLVHQWKLRTKVHSLEREKVYYLRMIEELRQSKKALLSDPALLERMAREKYLMKKPEEDLYIVENK